MTKNAGRAVRRNERRRPHSPIPAGRDSMFLNIRELPCRSIIRSNTGSQSDNPAENGAYSGRQGHGECAPKGHAQGRPRGARAPSLGADHSQQRQEHQ
jgi:hypothetical protein